MKKPVRWFKVLLTGTLLGTLLVCLAFVWASDGAVIQPMRAWMDHPLLNWRARQSARVLDRMTSLVNAADPVADARKNVASGQTAFYGFASYTMVIRGIPDPEGKLRKLYGFRDFEPESPWAEPWEREMKGRSFREFRYDFAVMSAYPTLMAASSRYSVAMEVYATAYNHALLAELRQRDPEVDAYMKKVEELERQADSQLEPLPVP